MKGKLIKDIFASSAQITINQAFSLVIFFITSTYLPKNIYGELNWCIAIITVIFSLLSFGMEPIIVKRLAAGGDVRISTGLFIQHTLLTGLLFIIILFSLFFLLPFFFRDHSPFILLSVSFLLTYLASPFKQLANGKQWFYYLAIMSTISNLVRAAALLVLIFTGHFNLNTVLLVFVFSSFCEWIGSVILMIRKTGIALLSFPWSKQDYFSLIRNALPQLGVTFFNISLARFDWIFLGIMTSAIVTADYSFTYRVYELCTLPLLIIAPLLLPRFTRFFANGHSAQSKDKKEILLVLLRWEIIIACFIALVLNLLWAPVMDGITGNKYGAVNSHTIFLLSCSMPFLYISNFLWTLHFSQGHLKEVLYVIMIIFFVNVIGDIVLIPYWKGEGAAAAFLAAIITQVPLYMRKTSFPGLSSIWLTLFICFAACMLSGIIATKAFDNPWLSTSLAVLLFTALLILGRQLRITDWSSLKRAMLL